MLILGLMNIPPLDDRSQCASRFFPDPKITTHWFAVIDRNDISPGVFRKLCK
jgi:hypothetical protein